MNQVQKIAQSINQIDTFYEFSDSNVKWEIEHRKVETIGNFLRRNSDLVSGIKNLLDNIGKVNFTRYFNGYS